MFENQEDIQIHKTNKPIVYIYFMLLVRYMKFLSSSTCHTVADLEKVFVGLHTVTI